MSGDETLIQVSVPGVDSVDDGERIALVEKLEGPASRIYITGLFNRDRATLPRPSAVFLLWDKEFEDGAQLEVQGLLTPKERNSFKALRNLKITAKDLVAVHGSNYYAVELENDWEVFDPDSPFPLENLIHYWDIRYLAFTRDRKGFFVRNFVMSSPVSIEIQRIRASWFAYRWTNFEIYAYEQAMDKVSKKSVDSMLSTDESSS